MIELREKLVAQLTPAEGATNVIKLPSQKVTKERWNKKKRGIWIERERVIERGRVRLADTLASSAFQFPSDYKLRSQCRVARPFANLIYNQHKELTTTTTTTRATVTRQQEQQLQEAVYSK